MSGLRRVNQWWDPAGLFEPRELRGGVVQTSKGPRVETFNPDGTPKGIGYLSNTLDADLNPAAIQEDYSNKKQQDALNELRDRETARYRDQSGRADRSLQASIDANNNQTSIGLAGILQSISADRNRSELLGAQIRQQGEQAQNAHQLALEQLKRSDITANRALDLKGLEMQANIQLQQQQLAEARGGRKLAFIGQAMQALMA